MRNQTSGQLVAGRVGVANTSKARRTGLLQHAGLGPDEGLWIVPCEAVHTFGMKFDIDVVYLNKARQIVKLRTGMKRRRMSLCFTAHSVLELAAGRASELGLAVGHQLEIRRLG